MNKEYIAAKGCLFFCPEKFPVSICQYWQPDVATPPPYKSSTGRNRCCLYPTCPQSSGLSASALPTSVPGRQLSCQYVWERRGGRVELNHCVINMCGWEVTGARQACKHLQLARAGLVNSSGDTKEAG